MNINLISQLLVQTDNVDLDDVLDYISALGDVEREKAPTHNQLLSDDDKGIVTTTINDVLQIITEKTPSEV